MHAKLIRSSRLCPIYFSRTIHKKSTVAFLFFSPFLFHSGPFSTSHFMFDVHDTRDAVELDASKIGNEFDLHAAKNGGGG